jgi:hypothetical protein
MSRYSHTKEQYVLTFFGIHDENSPDVVFNITNQGTTNYTSPPTITITPTPATLGTGMRATCTLTAGKVTGITLLSKGQGYAGATLAVAFAGGGGAGAAATATLVYKGYSRTIDNLTNFENIKRYRFNLNNFFNSKFKDDKYHNVQKWSSDVILLIGNIEACAITCRVEIGNEILVEW